jgi:phosphoribosylanthranilate isomerase
MSRTWIKFCATTSIDDALAAIEAGADALGFVFAPSKRRIAPDLASEITAQLPENVERVGVFTNESAERVAEVAEKVGLTAVQLHGDETPALIHELTGLLPGRSLGVIKTILVNDEFEARFVQLCRDYDCIDSILLDSGSGSGRIFDWQKVQPLLQRNGKRLIVAGGLNPGNVGEAIRRFSPWGVDVVSGVEREPGRKDPEKLKAFVAAVRRAEQS